MFSGITEVRPLTKSDLTPKIVSDINSLLKRQHTKADTVDAETIREHLSKSVIVVALQDLRVIRLGILIRGHCLSHSFGSIHNLIVQKDYDVLVLGMQIVKRLTEGIYDLDFIEAGTWLQDDQLIDILKALEFVAKPKLRYKLKLR